MASRLAPVKNSDDDSLFIASHIYMCSPLDHTPTCAVTHLHVLLRTYTPACAVTHLHTYMCVMHLHVQSRTYTPTCAVTHLHVQSAKSHDHPSYPITVPHVCASLMWRFVALGMKVQAPVCIHPHEGGIAKKWWCYRL